MSEVAWPLAVCLVAYGTIGIWVQRNVYRIPVGEPEERYRGHRRRIPDPSVTTKERLLLATVWPFFAFLVALALTVRWVHRAARRISMTWRFVLLGDTAPDEPAEPEKVRTDKQESDRAEVVDSLTESLMDAMKPTAIVSSMGDSERWPNPVRR